LKRTPLLYLFAAFFLGLSVVIILSRDADAADTDIQKNTPKVIHISSYDNSYSWNYNIVKEIHSIMNEHNIDVQTFYLDSHHLSPEQLIKRGKKFRDIILQEKPAAIIATDDAAAQYVIQPYFLDNKIPVVFAGVNWDASEYDLPASNTTGMIEINPTIELFSAMNRLVKKDMETVRIAFVGPETFTQRKNIHYETLLIGKDYNPSYLVRTFAEFKEAYIKAQQDSDYVYLGNLAGIEGWSNNSAREFMLNNTFKPTCGTIPTLAAETLLTFAKFPNEHADWAANTTLDIILNGKAPSDIPITKNTKAQIMLNTPLADKLKVDIPRDILELSVSVP